MQTIDVVHLGCVLHHHQLVRSTVEPDLLERVVTFAEQASLVRGVGPGAGNHLRATQRRAVVHVLDLPPDLVGGQDALFDQQLADRNLHRPVVGQAVVLVGTHRVGMIVVIVIVMRCVP